MVVKDYIGIDLVRKPPDPQLGSIMFQRGIENKGLIGINNKGFRDLYIGVFKISVIYLHTHLRIIYVNVKKSEATLLPRFSYKLIF